MAIGNAATKEILYLMKEFQLAKRDYKYTIWGRIIKLIKNMPINDQLKLVSKLDFEGLGLILNCGIHGEVYAKAIRRRFNLKNINKLMKS